MNTALRLHRFRIARNAAQQALAAQPSTKPVACSLCGNAARPAELLPLHADSTERVCLKCYGERCEEITKARLYLTHCREQERDRRARFGAIIALSAGITLICTLIYIAGEWWLMAPVLAVYICLLGYLRGPEGED